MATSASQAATNRANLNKALAAIAKGGGTATAAKNYYSSGSSSGASKVPSIKPTTSSAKVGSSTISSKPSVTPSVQLPSGTVGNPAGSKLPTGTAIANTKAAQTASAIGTPKKTNSWQDTLSNVLGQSKAPNAVAPSASGFGMTKDPNAIKPAPAPIKQTASAFDAFKAAQSNRVNRDLEALRLGTAAGSGIPSSNLMTRADGSTFPNQPVPKTDYKNLMAKSSLNGSTPLSNQTATLGNLVSTTPKVEPEVTPEPTVNNVSRTSSTISGGGEQQITQAPSVKTPGTVGLSNVAPKTLDLEAIPAAAGVADETKKQADAAQDAANAATTDEDKSYYQKLADDARQEADAAEEEYQRLLQQSEEERQVQAQLDAELQALELGKTDVAGQAIPLSFITGQQSALERRSLNRTAPLTSKLGQLQAARQAAMQGAKAKAGINENRLDRAESNLSSVVSEQRKRQQQKEDQKTKREQDLEDQAVEQANIDKKFNEDARRFGLEYAQKNREMEANKSTTPTGVKPNTYKNTQQIPESLRNDVLDDIVLNQGDLPDVIAAYPEISPSVIQAMFNQFSTKGRNVGGSGSREL